MRSVCFFKRAKSMFSIWLCRTISRAALSGMMPRRACARASAASIARQWPVLASSEKIRRISGLVNMSQKIEESSAVAAMLSLQFGEWRMANRARPPRNRIRFRHSLDDNARIAQVAIAVDQVDLPDLDQPAVCALHETMTAPACEESRSVHAEL